jgi:type IX secretion system PorP/SprF family membrane protein
MNMKKILILAVIICFGSVLKAQQLPQITQYMINDYAINPAVAGMEDFYQVKTTIRNQWVGLTDAPRTTMLSIYGSKSRNVGLGGLVYNDQTGPTSRIGGSASYTYSFSLTRSMKMAFALSGGFTQFKITKQGLNVLDANDYLLIGNDVVRTAPDATFGLNLYGKKWYIGAAIPQLLSSNLNLMDNDYTRIYNEVSEGSLERHIYVLGAYEHAFNPYWSVEPSVLIKTVSGAPMQLDLGIKTTYNDNLWVGMNYRNNGELAALVGYSIQERYIIGYSYDMMSALGASHEFMLGIRFIALEESDIIR